jgi:hypothetical protein
MRPAKIVLALFTSFALTQCAAPRAGSIEHVVLAWQKKPGDATDRAKIIAASKDLKAKIREVQSLRVGPALPSDRPIVDDSFDVALVMSFRDAAALRRYETHPVHTQAVKDVLKPLTSRILVYDVVSE